eukprot:UN12793
MTDEDAQLIHQTGTQNPIVLCCPHWACSKFITCRNIFAFLMVVFVAFAIVGFVWIYKGVVAIDSKYKTRVDNALFLLPFSFVDNPWIWKMCINMIRKCLEKRQNVPDYINQYIC